VIFTQNLKQDFNIGVVLVQLCALWLDWWAIT